MRFTEAQIGEWICRKLGFGTVGVELTKDHVDDSIRDAKEWWQSWVGQSKSVLVTLAGTREVAEALIATDVDSVVDVVFEIESDSIQNMYSWADVEINPYTWVSGGTGGNIFSTLVQYMQYRELSKQVTSSERDWEWDRSKRALVISPLPSAGSKVLVVYISKDMEISYMTNYETRVFRNYALAQAMKTLAGIRMKFSEKPGASGSFAMDGDSMWANGEAMEQEMEEKMRNLQEPVGFFAE